MPNFDETPYKTSSDHRKGTSIMRPFQLAMAPHDQWQGDGGHLLLVIDAFGVDQSGVGGLGIPPSGRAWSQDHFMYNTSILGASWGWGWWLPSPSNRHAWC